MPRKTGLTLAFGDDFTKGNLTANSLKALAVRFRAFDAKLIRDSKREVRVFHQKVNRKTAKTAPVRTGFMSRNVETRYDTDGLAAETGWFSDTFKRAKAQTRGRFYPPYPEFLHKPSLRPAFNEFAPEFETRMRNLYQASVRRAGRL